MKVHELALINLLGLLLNVPVHAATVLSVGDGDTIRVSDSGKRLTIRLACIDAPETAQTPYGAASRKFLQQLAPIGSDVTIRVLAADKYSRTVGEVLRKGSNLNLAMVTAGEAFVYRQYLSGCNKAAYLDAEAAAKRRSLGVWAVPGGIQRPWDWRRGSKGAAPSAAGGYSGQKLTCSKIGSHARAQELLREGHTYLDKDGDGQACESLR